MILLFLTLVAAGFFAYKWFTIDKDSVSERTIAGSFRSIAEVSAEEYNYTDVGRYDGEKRRLLGREVWGTGKYFIVTYNGTVKAGVKDFRQIEVSKDDEARDTIVDLGLLERTEDRLAELLAAQVSAVNTGTDAEHYDVVVECEQPGPLCGCGKAGVEKPVLNRGRLDRLLDETGQSSSAFVSDLLRSGT